jgi:Flp pilus assembly protein TadB
MKRMAIFMLVMLAAAVVVILAPWGPILKSEKSSKGSRTAARNGEDRSKRVLNKAREDHQERVVAVREGLSFDARPEVRTLPLVVRGVGRVVGYALLIVAAFAVSVALGAGIAVAMEYLVGWPDTWWL